MRYVFCIVISIVICLSNCNGDTSDSTAKSCGTAIGNPINPMPFSFVSDVFYKKKDAVVRIIGIRISNNETSSAKSETKDDKQPDSTKSPAGKNPELSNKILFGSGFFIDDMARVVTSAIIVDDATNIWVEFNGLSYAAELVGSDRITNIAIVRLLKKPDHFDIIDITDGKPKGNVCCGEFLVSVECKLGLDPSPNFGIIVGENSSYGSTSFPVKLTRTNLPIDGGETGSPVFSIDGTLAGIMIASLPDMRSSFLMPAWTLDRVCSDIIKTGGVTHCTAGFFVHQQYTQENGVQILVSRIQQDSPAEKAGILIDDVISAINGNKIVNIGDIANSLFLLRPGDIVNIDIIRKGNMLQLPVKLDDQSHFN
ncbi:MAG: S1C family serine protease [Puniceicoccales bacterium]|jgi:serine protease Do|nr:S1C family serine protease [Puniceicoccales bacterium]